MVRISLELFQRCPQFVNPLRDREVDMRGHKLQRIENLMVLQDGFDTLDLSDNEIRRLENFCLMKRLKTLFLHHNGIEKISSGLARCLPHLHTLALHRNAIAEFSDLDGIGEIASLRRLSLLDNPVTKKPNYRLYVVTKAPQVIVLDFLRVKDAERQHAKGLYGVLTETTSGGGGAATTTETIPSKESLMMRLAAAVAEPEIDEIEGLLQRHYGGSAPN